MELREGPIWRGGGRERDVKRGILGWGPHPGTLSFHPCAQTGPQPRARVHHPACTPPVPARPRRGVRPLRPSPWPAPRGHPELLPPPSPTSPGLPPGRGCGTSGESSSQETPRRTGVCRSRFRLQRGALPPGSEPANQPLPRPVTTPRGYHGFRRRCGPRPRLHLAERARCASVWSPVLGALRDSGPPWLCSVDACGPRDGRLRGPEHKGRAAEEGLPRDGPVASPGAPGSPLLAGAFLS